MKKLTLIILIILTNILSYSQLENIPLITVKGEGVIKIKPDHVVLGFKIQKSIKLNSNENPANLEIFKKRDIDIKLFNFNEKEIDKSLIQPNNSVYITEIFITIKDLNRLDKILLDLKKIGYGNFHYIDYRIHNYSDLKNKARIKAINLAKEKATLLANELGQDIGKAHSIEEIDCPNYNWYNINKNDNIENIPFLLDSEEYLIDPGYIIITSKIKVSFDLIKK